MAPDALPRIVFLAADLAGWEECGLLQVCPEAVAVERLADAISLAQRDRAVVALWRPTAEQLGAARAAGAGVIVGVRPQDLPVIDGLAEVGARRFELLVTPATSAEVMLRARRAAAALETNGADEISHLRQQSRRDDVTGLPGAWLYRDRLEQSLRARGRTGGHLTAAILRLGRGRRGELDGVSTAQLRSVAARVRAAIRASDTVAHEGHQGAVSRGAAAELLLLLPDLAEEAPQAVLQRIHQIAIADNVDTPGQTLLASIGYAVAGDQPVDADELLRRARTALDRADVGEIRCGDETPAGESSAADAEVPGPVEVWYQPMLRDDGTLLALACEPRWRHPGLGLLGEAELMLFAIDAGVVRSVTRSVLDGVCRQWRQWRDAIGEVTVTVPLRGAALRQEGLQAMLGAALERHDVPPWALVFEVAEEELLASAAAVSGLRSLGAAVAIADLGAGPTALRSFERCSAGWVKIDAALVHRLPESAEAMSTVRLLLAMARSAAVEPVAVAVDSDRQLRALRALGCELFQGWEVHAPAPADALVPLLRRSRRAGQEARVVPIRASV